MREIFYWFGFRQTYPKPRGEVVLCGPFHSYDEAKRDRENSKEWDCEVGIPFSAATREDAWKQVKTYMSL